MERPKLPDGLPTPDWCNEEFGIALYNRDCLELLPQIPDGCVDAVVTDPPYGVGFKGKTWQPSTGPRVNATGYVNGDDPDVGAAAIKWIVENHPNMPILVTPGTRQTFKYPAPRDIGTFFNKAGVGSGPWGFNCNNPILYYGKCPYLSRGKGRRPNSFQQCGSDKSDNSIAHPCPKPIGVMEWMVNRASLVGNVVADPFFGSGTTAVACINTNRAFIGCEISADYFKIAVKRIEDAIEKAKGGALFTESNK